MVVFLISIIVSTIPSFILYKWLINRKDNELFKIACKESLKKGILCVFPILLVSMTFYIIGYIFRKIGMNPLLYQAYYKFITLALSEELVKFLTFKSILKKTNYKYDYFDVVIFMSIVGLGFGIIENISFSFASSIVSMFIKGISLAHAGYGFIIGYFYSKSLKTNKKRYILIGFLISWILHGLYDFGLSDEFISLNDNLIFVSITLILVSIVTIVYLIRFVKKHKLQSI